MFASYSLEREDIYLEKLITWEKNNWVIMVDLLINGMEIGGSPLRKQIWFLYFKA